MFFRNPFSERFKFRVFQAERPERPKRNSTTSTKKVENVTGGKYSVCAQDVHITRKRIGIRERLN